MRGRIKWTSKYDERSNAPGAEVVGDNVVNRGGSLLEQLFARLRNGCSAEYAKLLDALFISPRQPKNSAGANGMPPMVGSSGDLLCSKSRLPIGN